MRRAAAGMPTSSRRPIARLRAAASLMGRCVRIVSTSCRPTVYSGLSDVSGSWKTAPISRPRMVRIASYGRLSMRRPGEPDLAGGDAPRRIDEPDDRGAGQRLARAGLADHAQHLAGRDRRTRRRARRRACRGASGTRRAGPRRRATGRPRPNRAADSSRSLGFSASRSQSPSRLIDSTMTTSAAPGKMVIHHSPENKKSLPMRISVPSDGSVGGTPTPRNDSVASVRIAVAMLIVASTSTGPSTLGSRCRAMIPSGDHADDARGLHVLLVLLHHRRAAHRARVLHPVGQADREDQHRQHRDLVVRIARQRHAGHAVDQQRDQDRRERQLDVGDAHDERVDLAADVAGDEAERHAEHHRERDRRESRPAARRARRT